MPQGIWTIGRTDVGTANANTPGVADHFRHASTGTAAGTAGIVISAKPGRFYRGQFVNGAATAYFIQIFNKATAPVNADVPIYSKRLAVSSEVEINLADVNGLVCTAGISIALSSTAGVLTLALADNLAFRSVIYTASNV